MTLDPRTEELAAALPDLPRWVGPRGLLLARRGELLAGPEGTRGAGYVVVERGGKQAFAVHRPVARLVEELRARVEIESLFVPLENAEPWRAPLAGWREESAVLHVHPAPASLPGPQHETRLLVLGDVEDFGRLPAPLAAELALALTRGPVAAAFREGRAVSFCHAAYRTESWFDLSIDTLDEHRRQGFATSAASCLIQHLLREQKKPVWGALDADAPSLAMAKKYGFRAVDRLSLFRRV
jgi:hypothetical protein